MIWRRLSAVGPYYCAQNDEIIATTDCMDTPQNINVSALAVYTNNFASHELIDPPGNMTKDRVFILSGMEDHTVLQGNTCLYMLLYQHHSGRRGQRTWPKTV